jgi:hypothetical protein
MIVRHTYRKMDRETEIDGQTDRDMVRKRGRRETKRCTDTDNKEKGDHAGGRASPHPFGTPHRQISGVGKDGMKGVPYERLAREFRSGG